MTGPIQNPHNYEDMLVKYQDAQLRGEKKVLKRLGAMNMEEAKDKVLEEIKYRAANQQQPALSETKHTGTIIKDPENSAVHALKKELIEGFVKTAITPDQHIPQPLEKGRASPAA